MFTIEQASTVKHFVLEASNGASEVAHIFDDIDDMTEADDSVVIADDMQPLWVDVNGEMEVWWRE